MFYVTQDPLGSLETGDKLFRYQFFRSHCIASVSLYKQTSWAFSKLAPRLNCLYGLRNEFWGDSLEISFCLTIPVRIPQASIGSSG